MLKGRDNLFKIPVHVLKETNVRTLSLRLADDSLVIVGAFWSNFGAPRAMLIRAEEPFDVPVTIVSGLSLPSWFHHSP